MNNMVTKSLMKRKQIFDMKNGILKILAVGDVVGKNGLEFIRKNLWDIRKRYDADIVIVNGENSAPGNGITIDSANTLFSSGADIITTGNHVFRRAEIYNYLDDTKGILRPANYPPPSYGFGHGIFGLCGKSVLVMNLLGNVYMEAMRCPFETAETILEKEKGNYDIAIADFHAEATSEKMALGYYLDGKVSAVFGTHTHIQTADLKILPKGTGYITDLGMTGPAHSILGLEKSTIINRFLDGKPQKFTVASGKGQFCGAIFEIDENCGKTIGVERIYQEL